MKICLIIFSLLIHVPWTTAQANNHVQQKASYIFSVLPYRPIPKLEADFSPFISEINRHSHFTMSLKLSLNSIKYFEMLKQQVPDFALINPFDSVPAQDTFGYQPVLARPMHRCKVVTLKKNNINTVEDLRNKKVGFASKRSPLSFYSARALEKEGLIADKDYIKINHKSLFKCLHSLVISKVDACTAGQKTVQSFKKHRNIGFKELAQCEAFPGLVLMAHERVSKSDVEQFKKVFLNRQNQTKSKVGHKHKGFGPYISDRYESIRKHYSQWLNDQ